MGWDKGRYHIERECTCRKGQRNGECKPHTPDAFHVVATATTEAEGREVLEECRPLSDARYRLTDSTTGAVIVE